MKISSLLKSFSKKKFIGCDLGASTLKIVKLQADEDRIRLLGQALLKVPDTLGDDERGDQIQKFLAQNNFAIDGVLTLNIEDSTLFIRRMDLPKMPERDLLTAIRWNFRQFVDGSIDDCIVSYLPIAGVAEEGKDSFSAFCVARQAVENRKMMMKNSGFKVSAIEPSATALLATFNRNYRVEANKYYVVVDLGQAISTFIVIGNGSLMFSRPLINLHGRGLVDLVMTSLVISKEEAEEQVKQYIDFQSQHEATMPEIEIDKIGQTVSDFISQMIVELQRSIDAFCIMYKKDRVERIYLCGGGIVIPEIVSRLSSGLGLEVELLNPFRNILDAETAVKLNNAPMYAVAVGLALPGD